MTKLTKKAFNVLHQKMMSSTDYRAGYLFGDSHRELYSRFTLDELKAVRRRYIMVHTQYTAGLARVLFELICERENEKGAVA